jgi:hypothetical protein
VNSPRIAFGDKVRVRASHRTEKDGIAGRIGIVHGFTTPSQTGVEVVGECTDDYAIAVMIEGKSSAIWVDESLLELIDHQPGTVVQIGSRRLIRDQQGEWRHLKLN